MSWPIEEFFILQYRTPTNDTWTIMQRASRHKDLLTPYRDHIRVNKSYDYRIARAISYKDQEGELGVRALEIYEYREGKSQEI